jgi:hypothetical protein
MAPARSVPIDSPRQRRRIAQNAETGQIGERPGSYLVNVGAFRIEAGAAEILIDPFLSDNPSWDKGWSGYLAGKNATQGGDR